MRWRWQLATTFVLQPAHGSTLRTLEVTGQETTSLHEGRHGMSFSGQYGGLVVDASAREDPVHANDRL
jgi:hypothetical protein